jgi:hypothetical protein
VKAKDRRPFMINNEVRGGGAPRAWTHLRVDRRSATYLRVTFDHPPINTITATTVGELAELVGLIEADRSLNVVVFDSANPSIPRYARKGF